MYQNNWSDYSLMPRDLCVKVFSTRSAKKLDKGENIKYWKNKMKDFVDFRKNLFNNEPQKALIDACLCGDLERVQEILKAKPNMELNYEIEMDEYTEVKKFSPLSAAMCFGESTLLMLLKACGARDPEFHDNAIDSSEFSHVCFKGKGAK